jgi:hypothetical protein
MNPGWITGLRDLVLGKRKPTVEDLQYAAEVTKQLRDFVAFFLPIGPEKVDMFAYADMIRYFVDQRPADDAVKGGAVLREDHDQGVLITQVFVDAENELVIDDEGRPHGRRFVAIELDQELSTAFGDTNLIIVE